MKPRKFFGPNSREVLKQVRETLGADALILSNSRAPGGIEVVAVAGAAVNELITAGGRIDPQERPLPWVAPRIDGRVEPKPGTAARAPEQTEAPGTPSVAPVVPRPAAETGSVESMIAELRAMRGLLEQQLAGLAWNELARRDPGKVAALRLLLAAGFSSGSARTTTDRMPEAMAEEEAPRWLIAELNRELETSGAENDIIERGGVYALVGPTGVGKTTTAAKLAARCVVKHGADKLALVTTDTYRIGAHEQLRIYGRILGVPTYSTKDAQELKNVLAELRGRHMVLIDTIGMSQRDRLVAEQASLLRESGSHLRRLLLLNASCNGETLDDVVAAYGAGGVAGCILTKLDEAQSIGPALDCVLRHRLTLHFVTNGQRVPEDLHLPNRSYLIHRALKSAPEGSIHKPVDSEYPLMLAAARSIARRGEEGARAA